MASCSYVNMYLCKIKPGHNNKEIGWDLNVWENLLFYVNIVQKIYKLSKPYLLISLVNGDSFFLVAGFHFSEFQTKNEPLHVKTNNVAVRSAKIQISLGIRPV